MKRILIFTFIILQTLTAFSQSETITYYPYQIRSINNLTGGLEISLCNYRDPTCTITFSNGTPISVGNIGLSYYTTDNSGNDIYSYDTNNPPSDGYFIGFPDNNPNTGMVKITSIPLVGFRLETFTNYTTTDMRGSGSNGYSNGGGYYNGNGYSNGGGYYNGNGYNNGGSHNHSSGTICKSCSGTGKCTLCKGAGYYWQDSGAYVGRTINEKVRCPSCNGSGNCQVCYGAGSIR